MPLFGSPDVAKLEAKGDAQGLIKALSYEKDGRVRQAAATALGEIGCVPAVEPLIAALKDFDSDVRRATARALARIGDPRAVPPLIELLRDRNEDVRLVAVQALGNFRSPGATNSLLGVVMGDKESKVASAAADALKQIGWAPGNDESGARFWIARRDWSKCVEIGAAAVAPLVDVMRGGGISGNAAAKAIEEIGLPAVPELVAARKSQGEALRPRLDSILEQISGAPGLVARHDWDACVKLGAPSIRSLAEALADPSEEVREAVVRTLGTIGAEAVEALVQRLKNADRHVRWQAADALGRIADPAAVKPLAAARGDSDEYVRQAAEGALTKIATANPGIKIPRAAAEPKPAAESKAKPAGGSDVLKGIWEAGANPASVSIEGVTMTGAMSGFMVGQVLKRRNYSIAHKAGRKVDVTEATVDLFVAGLHVVGGSIRDKGGTFADFCRVEKELSSVFDSVFVPMAKRIDSGTMVSKIGMENFPLSLRSEVSVLIGMRQVIEFLNEYAY